MGHTVYLSGSHGLGSLWISCSALKGWQTPQAMQMWFSAVHEEVVHNHLQLSWSCHLHQRYTTHLEHGHVVVGEVPHAGVLGVLVRQSRAVVGLQELLTGE